MQRSIVRTAQAPAAIGPYSQAVVVPVGDGARMIFCSGQTALDPVTGQMIEGDVAAVLSAAGARFADVVRTTVYLASMDDFGNMNGVYGERFASEPPARSTI